MGSYNGGSTILDSRSMGRSESDFLFSARSLYGGDGFKDAAEFARYCDLMARMRAYAENYEAASQHPLAMDRIQDMIVATMLEVGSMEVGKHQGLLSVIKEAQGWPEQFLLDLAASRMPAPRH